MPRLWRCHRRLTSDILPPQGSFQRNILTWNTSYSPLDDLISRCLFRSRGLFLAVRGRIVPLFFTGSPAGQSVEELKPVALLISSSSLRGSAPGPFSITVLGEISEPGAQCRAKERPVLAFSWPAKVTADFQQKPRLSSGPCIIHGPGDDWGGRLTETRGRCKVPSETEVCHQDPRSSVCPSPQSPKALILILVPGCKVQNQFSFTIYIIGLIQTHPYKQEKMVQLVLYWQRHSLSFTLWRLIWAWALIPVL